MIMKKLLNLLLKLNKKKLLLAFEYGLVISNVAKEHGVEVTSEFVQKAEEMIENEFLNNDATRLSIDMIPNIMSIFETNMDE